MAAPLPVEGRGVASVLTSGAVGGARNATRRLLGRPQAEISGAGSLPGMTSQPWAGATVAELAATG